MGVPGSEWKPITGEKTGSLGGIRVKDTLCVFGGKCIRIPKVASGRGGKKKRRDEKLEGL